MNGDLCFVSELKSELKAVSEHFKRYFSLVLQEGGCHFVLEGSSCCYCCCCFSPKGRKRGEDFIPKHTLLEAETAVLKPEVLCWVQRAPPARRIAP